MSYRTKRYKKRKITKEDIIQKQLGDAMIDLNPDTIIKLSKSVPRLMTDDRLSKFFNAISLGASYDTACKFSGLSTSILYKWLNLAKEDIMSDIQESPYVEFQEKLNKIEAEYEVGLLYDINKMIEDRDPFIGHLIKYLSVKYPKKWGTNGV